MHLLNLVVLGILILLFFTARKTGKSWTKINDYLGIITKTINSVRYGDLTKKLENVDLPNSEPLVESLNRMIETLNDRENMIREYQSELTKKNNFLSALLNSLSDGMIVFNDKQVIIDANKNIKKWLKNTKIIGSRISDYISVSEGKPYIELFESEVFLKNEKDRFFLATTRKLETKEHTGMYMMLISDCTNQKEIESLKEDFVATLTHDLKVPIIAEANMLDFFIKGKFGKLSDSQLETLNTMQASNTELLELVQTVLDTYKVKEGEIELILEEVSVQRLMSELKEEMIPIANKNENNIVINLKSDFSIQVDYLQIKRVLKNLINNSIIYGKPKTNIEITAKQKNDYSYIYVKDYGKGIAKEEIDKVFNKYYSAHKKFRKIGTGLGLYIVKGLASAMNIEIKFSAEDEFIMELKFNDFAA